MGRSSLTIADAKARIRRIAADRRASLSDRQRRLAGESISGRVVDLVRSMGAETVHLYWPIIGKHEVDIRPAIRQFLVDGLAVALPHVESAHDRIMTQRLLTDESELSAGPFGTFQPASGATVALSETDLVVVPAFAVDRSGSRIGYGVGFYDRFLAEVGCPVTAVVYSVCLFDVIPVEPHDVRVQFVVTELDTIVTDESAT